MAEYGDLIDELRVGPLTVQVKHSCVRRDLYEIHTPAPLPAEVRSCLARYGTMRGTDRLYVVEVPEVHQITVAPAAGRVVIVPRMQPARTEQRRAATAVARQIAELVRAETSAKP
jgi:hypothetical protein